MSKQTNLKPKEWYEEWIIKISRFPDDELEERISEMMERDKIIDINDERGYEEEIRWKYCALRNLPEDSLDKKDIIELQRDVIEYVEKLINVKEIKRYLKSWDFYGLYNYKHFCHITAYLKKGLDEGYSSFFIFGYLLYLMEDPIEEYKRIKKSQMPFHTYVFKVLKGASAVIAEELVKGKSYEQIDRANKDITMWNVMQTSKRLGRVNHKDNLGFLFEDYFALVKLGMPEEFLSELVAHNSNEPDIIWEDKIYSLKYRNDDKHKTLTFRQSIDCKPEYLEAIKRESTYFFVFFNPKWSQEILIKEIDPIKDSDKIVCKPNRIIVDKAIKDFEI